MTKAQLIDDLSLEADIGTKAAAARTVEFIIAKIKETVKAGESAEISGLGKFYPFMQKGKNGKVPGTNKEYSTQDKMVPKFKAAKGFKDLVAK